MNRDDSLPNEMNPLQRWFLRRSLPRYAKLPSELRAVAIERDHYLLGPRAIGLWCALVGAIVGSSLGLAKADTMPVWIALVFSIGLFGGLFKAGVGAWLYPARYSAARLWRIFWIVLIASYAGSLTSVGNRLQELRSGGAGWVEALWQVFWCATRLQFVAFVAALLLLGVLAAARREVARRELALARASRESTQARLNLLQAQIQPHFLFNTLAALQHWVDVGDARAAPLLRTLTGFLRGSTELMLRDSVTLAQECEIVRHYLAIMRSRLGERLRWRIDVAPECEAQPRPPGLLITLVENAVEHGIGPQLHGGELQLIARRLDRDDFELCVLDDGAGLAPNAPEGVGLTNSRERLRHQFGARAELALSARAGGAGTQVRLRIRPEFGGAKPV